MPASKKQSQREKREKKKEKQKAQIRKILEQHVGKNNAIDAGEIGRRVGIRENATHATTRGLITELMQNADVPIGAHGKGFFIIETEQELWEYTGKLQDRMLGVESRIVNVKRAFIEKYGPLSNDDTE